MKISVNNIGLIDRAEITLNGITVIGGYNRSGKSTILKSAYSLIYSNVNIRERIAQERKRSFIRAIWHADGILGYLYRNASEAEKLWNEIENHYADHRNITLEQVQKFIRDRFEQEKKNNIDFLEQNGPDEEKRISDEQIKKLYQSIETVLHRSDSEYERFIFSKNFQNIFHQNINSVSGTKKGKIQIQTKEKDSFAEFDDNKMCSYKSYPNFVNSIWYLNTSHFTDMLDYRRTPSVMSYELRKALIQKMDSDISYEMFNDIEENTDTFQSILEEILHGELDVSDSGRNIVYRDKSVNTSFEMENVASGMKNLLVIQKLVQNGAMGRNSILLIDEPESNLHPEWQVKLAEVLVLLNKELDINILINSHSPYFMRAEEVSLADHSRKEKGKYYIMRENESGYFYTEDVTERTDEIYKLLYKPLEYL